jgi:hypothetical protein
MRIEITSRHTPDGKAFFEWSLWDGPDGIDHAHGYASDLIVAFSKLIEWRERISRDYDDLYQDNETNCGSAD